MRPGRASASEWWGSRHDEHNTGQYGVDTRSPGVARNARIEKGELRFKAPGDDWYGGRADRYTVRFTRANGKVDTRVIDADGRAGSVQRVDLLPNTRTIRVRAVDEAGNVGGWKLVRR